MKVEKAALEQLLASITILADVAVKLLNEGNAENETPAPVETTKEVQKAKKSKKQTTKVVEPVAEESDDAFPDDFGFGDGEDEESNDVPEIILDDVMDAFKTFIGKFKDRKLGTANAAKVLKKFGCKNTRDLDPADYPRVLEILSSKK